MDAIREEIELGARICSRLKNIYFKDTAWINCYKLIASKFTFLKNKARKFYPDKTSIEIIQELLKYKDQDLMDAFE